MPLVNINAAYTAQDVDNFIKAALATSRMSDEFKHDEFKHDESDQDDFIPSSPHIITEKIFIENTVSDVMLQNSGVEPDKAEPRGQGSHLGRYVLLNQQVCRLPAGELEPQWLRYADQTDPNGFVQTLWCTLLITEALPVPQSTLLEPNTIYLAKYGLSQTEAQFCFKTIDGQVIRGMLAITKFSDPALKEAILTCNETFKYTREDVIEVKDLVQYEERIYPALRQAFIRPVAERIRHHIESWVERREAASHVSRSSSESDFDAADSESSQAQALKFLWPVQIRQVWYVVEWLVADKLADCRLWVHSPYEESGVWPQELHTVLQGLQHELSLFERENRRLFEFYTRSGYTSMSALQRPQTARETVQGLLSGQSLRQKEYSPLRAHAEVHYGHCVLLSEDTHSSGAAAVEITQKRCQGGVLERRSTPLPRGAMDLRLKQLAQCDALGLPVAPRLRTLPLPETQLTPGLLAREAKSEADLRMDSLAWETTDFQVCPRGAEPPIYAFRELDNYGSSRLVATAAKYGDSPMLKGLVHFGSILTPYHTALLDAQRAQKSQSKDPRHQQTRYQNQLIVLEKLDELLAVVETSSALLDHQATWKSQNEDFYDQQERHMDQTAIPEELGEWSVATDESSILLEDRAARKSQNEDPDHKQSQQKRYENRYQRQVVMTRELDELLVRDETSSLLEMIKKGQLLGKLCQYLFEEDTQLLLTTRVLSAQALARLQSSLTILLRYLNGIAQVEKARLQTARQRGINDSRWDPTPLKQAVYAHLYQLNLLDAKVDGIQRPVPLSLTVFKRGASHAVLVTNEQRMSWVVSLDELAVDGLFPVEHLPWEAFADVFNAQGRQVDDFERWFVRHCPHTQSSERYTVHLMQSEPPLPEPFAVDVFRERGGYHAIVRNGLQIPERLMLSEDQKHLAGTLPWSEGGNYRDVSIPYAKDLAKALVACCSHTDPYKEIGQIVTDLESFIPILQANIPMTGQLSWQLEQPTVWLGKNPFERIEGKVNTTAQLRLLPELLEVLREVNLLLRSPQRAILQSELETAEPLVRSHNSLQDSLGFALLYQMRKVMRQQSTFEENSRYYTMQEDGKFVELNDEGLEALQKVNAMQLKRDLDDVVQLLEDFFDTVPQMSIQMLRDKLQASRKRCEAKLADLHLPDEKQFAQEEMLPLLEALQMAVEKDRCARLAVLIDAGRLRVGGLTKFELKEKLIKRQARDYAYLLLSDQRPYSHTWLDYKGKNTLFHVLCYFGRCWDFAAQLIETPLRGIFESHFSKEDWRSFETIRENCIARDYLGKLAHEGMNEAGFFPQDIGSMLGSPTEEKSSQEKSPQEKSPQWLLDGLLRDQVVLQNRWPALTTWLSVFPARSVFYRAQFGVTAEKEPSYDWVFARQCGSNRENLFYYLVNQLTQQPKSTRADTQMVEQMVLTRLLTQYTDYRRGWAHQIQLYDAYTSDQRSLMSHHTEESRLVELLVQRQTTVTYRPQDRWASLHTANPMMVVNSHGESALRLLVKWQPKSGQQALLKCRVLNEMLLTLLPAYRTNIHPVSPFMEEVCTALFMFQREGVPAFYEQAIHPWWERAFRVLTNGFRRLFDRGARIDLTRDAAEILGRMSKGLVLSSESNDDQSLEVALKEILRHRQTFESRRHPCFQSLFTRLEEIHEKYSQALRELSSQQYTYHLMDWKRFQERQEYEKLQIEYKEKIRCEKEGRERAEEETRCERERRERAEDEIIRLKEQGKSGQREPEQHSNDERDGSFPKTLADKKATRDEKAEEAVSRSATGTAQAGLFGGRQRNEDRTPAEEPSEQEKERASPSFDGGGTSLLSSNSPAG